MQKLPIFLATLLLALTGCTAIPAISGKEEHASYERALTDVFALNGLPHTQVVVTDAPVPADAQAAAALLIDEAIIYDKSLNGQVRYAKAKDLPEFQNIRDGIVQELLDNNLYEQRDRLVTITLKPDNLPSYTMYGLEYADGTPKTDAILAKEAQGIPDNLTQKGSWTQSNRVTFKSSVLGMTYGKLVARATMDNDNCHDANSNATIKVEYEGLGSLGLADAECLPMIIEKYGKSHPYCSSTHTNRPGEQDCMHYVTVCTVITGVGADNNLKLNLGASGSTAGTGTASGSATAPGNVTVVAVGNVRYTFQGSVAIDESFFQKSRQYSLEGRLCACSGDPDATSFSDDGKTQSSHPGSGIHINTGLNELNPLEQPSFCAKPVEMEPTETTSSPSSPSHPAGGFGSQPPSQPAALGGTR